MPYRLDKNRNEMGCPNWYKGQQFHQKDVLSVNMEALFIYWIELLEKYIDADCHLSFCILKLLVLCCCCLIKLCSYHYSCYDKVLLVEDDFKQQTKRNPL